MMSGRGGLGARASRRGFLAGTAGLTAAAAAYACSSDKSPAGGSSPQPAGTPSATFTAPNVASPIELRFRVDVEDGRGGIGLDDVSITVTLDDPMTTPDPMKPGAPMGTGGDEIGGGCGCTASEADAGAHALLLIGLLLLFRRRR